MFATKTNYYFVSGMLSNYVKLGDKWCGSSYGNYKDIATAINDCNNSNNCTAVYGVKCDNDGPFKLCPKPYTEKNSVSGSCLFVKGNILFRFLAI